MKIKYHKRFEKQFKKLLIKDRQRVIETIDIFFNDPCDRCLQNHALKGSLSGKRSMSAGPDLRIIFEEIDDYTLVIFLDLGKHNRVYK
jgi:addiction module RelE/StbE family toxin